MKGRIYTWQSCRCGGEWEYIIDPVTKDVLNIICRGCRGAPELVGVDARSFKNRQGTVGKITHEKNGDFIHSVYHARRILEAVRHDWDEFGPERFPVTKWSKSGRETYKLSECAKEWQLRLEQSGKSKGYTVHVELFFRKYILPQLGEVDVREITGDDVEKLQLSLRNAGKSANTVKSCLQVLRTLLVRYMERKQVLTRIPAFPEGWSANPRQDRWIVTEETQRKVWARMPEDTHLLMETYCALGCRPGEVCGLKRRDLLENGDVLIQRSIDTWGKEKETKTGRSRTHPLPAGLHARLCALPLLPDAFLFTRGGEPFNPNRLSNAFRAAAKDYPQVTLYTFARHSLATRIKRDAEKKAIAEAAGRIGNTAQVCRDHYIQG